MTIACKSAKSRKIGFFPFVEGDLVAFIQKWPSLNISDTPLPLLGPWIATADEIPDPQNLKIQCRVNGQVMQESHTCMMIFPVARLVHFLSKHFTLLPGDVILTGTPHGVGSFRKPAVYL